MAFFINAYFSFYKRCKINGYCATSNFQFNDFARGQPNAEALPVWLAFASSPQRLPAIFRFCNAALWREVIRAPANKSSLLWFATVPSSPDTELPPRLPFLRERWSVFQAPVFPRKRDIEAAARTQPFHFARRPLRGQCGKQFNKPLMTLYQHLRNARRRAKISVYLKGGMQVEKVNG